jgi:hypothetical protein
MRRCLFALAILLVSPAAYAQAPPSVPLNQPFQLVADHDGVNTTGYRCFLDGVKVGADLPVPAGTVKTITCAFAALATAGAHTASVSAFNASGEGRLDVAVNVPLPPPGKPSNPRILVNGTVVQNGVTVPAQFTLAVNVNPKTKAATLKLLTMEPQ